MKKRKIFKVLCVLVFCLGLAVPAQGGNFFVGAGVGTLGAGLDLGYQFNNWIKVRVNGNYLPFDYSLTYNDIDYDMELRNLSAGLLFDLHPFGGEFRVTAGAYYRDLNVNLEATSNRTVKIGDDYYSASEFGKLDGEITWDKFAPYAGIGWGLGSGTGSKFSLDFNLGAMTLRGAEVEYQATGLDALRGQPRYDELRQDLDREAEKIKDKINDWNVYPVVSLFFSFRF